MYPICYAHPMRASYQLPYPLLPPTPPPPLKTPVPTRRASGPHQKGFVNQLYAFDVTSVSKIVCFRFFSFWFSNFRFCCIFSLFDHLSQIGHEFLHFVLFLHFCLFFCLITFCDTYFRGLYSRLRGRQLMKSLLHSLSNYCFRLRVASVGHRFWPLPMPLLLATTLSNDSCCGRWWPRLMMTAGAAADCHNWWQLLSQDPAKTESYNSCCRCRKPRLQPTG